MKDVEVVSVCGAVRCADEVSVDSLVVRVFGLFCGVEELLAEAMEVSEGFSVEVTKCGRGLVGCNETSHDYLFCRVYLRGGYVSQSHLEPWGASRYDFLLDCAPGCGSPLDVLNLVRMAEPTGVKAIARRYYRMSELPKGRRAAVIEAIRDANGEAVDDSGVVAAGRAVKLPEMHGVSRAEAVVMRDSSVAGLMMVGMSHGVASFFVDRLGVKGVVELGMAGVAVARMVVMEVMARVDRRQKEEPSGATMGPAGVAGVEVAAKVAREVLVVEVEMVGR